MPIYEFRCETCEERREVLAQMGDAAPNCCGVAMSLVFGSYGIRDSRSITGTRNELFIDRIDEIHKRQADRGERLRFVHPSEVMT